MCNKLGTLAFPIAFFALLASAAPNTHAAPIVVGKNVATCPHVKFAKIQDAVNAASPGDRIEICPGTYAEQVVINKPLLVIGSNGAILEPTNMTANTTSLATGNPIAAILLVEGTTDVIIRDLTVDGTNNGITECSPDLIGIFYRNSSGTLGHMAVRNTKLTTTLNGCQSGLAIFAQSGAGGSTTLTIEQSSIHDYQKNGITANEADTQVTIEGNVVTGLGSTTGAAQNGIQIGFGAAGSIRNNEVANHVWSPCVSVASCTATADDILVFQSNNVIVEHNRAGVSQTGIAIVGDEATVSDNAVFDSQIFDGILLNGNENSAERNHVTHSDQAGVLISGNNNTVQHNFINEAAIGVLKIAGSTGNIIAPNSYFNTPIQVQDPSARALSRALPYR